MATQLDRIESRLTKILGHLKITDTENGGPDPAPTPVPNPNAGANPAAVQSFIDLIMVPSAGADPAAVAQRRENLLRWEQQFNEATFDGMFGVWTLTEADKAYLASVQERYFRKTGKDIMRDGLIGGKNVHLNQARNDGEHRLNNTDLSSYESELKREVERRLHG